jgi:hypothetical protein
MDPPGALQCAGDENWTARDCVRLGLRMDDLCDFGMVGVQQYEDLMVGLSKPDAVAAERELQVTAEHIGALVDLMAAAPDAAPLGAAVPIAPVSKKTVVPPRQPIQQQQQQEEESLPPMVVEEKVFNSRPVAVAVPISVGRPKNVATPPTTTTAATVTIVGNKNRFDRHGALVRHVIIK